MHPKNTRPISAVLIASVLVLSACLGGGSQTPPTRFYVLNSLYTAENKSQPVADLREAVVVIGPLALTQVLDRPQIIIRQSSNEIRVSDLDRWASPIHENFLRVVVDNLAVLLDRGRVVAFPVPRSIPVDYQVTMEVTRFDGKPGDEVVLRARWAILGDSGGTVLLKQQSVLTEPTGGDTIAEMVSAQSRLVAMFSRDIAEALKEIEEKGAGK